jgi:hypothetical protein
VPFLGYPNLRAHLRANRGNLLVAALTILRAYVAAGRPADLPPLGNFEAWSAVVRQAVHWITGHDPCAARATILPESRGDVAALAAVLDGWSRLPGAQGDGMTAKRALALGYSLRAARDRVAGPWRLRAGEDMHSKVATWRVERVSNRRAGDAGHAEDGSGSPARQGTGHPPTEGPDSSPASPASPAGEREVFEL